MSRFPLLRSDGRRAYTSEDDAEIARRLAAGEQRAGIAAALDRTMVSLGSRVRYLRRVGLLPPSPRVVRPYSDGERAAVIAMIRSGKEDGEIGQILDRTRRGIETVRKRIAPSERHGGTPPSPRVNMYISQWQTDATGSIVRYVMGT